MFSLNFWFKACVERMQQVIAEVSEYAPDWHIQVDGHALSDWKDEEFIKNNTRPREVIEVILTHREQHVSI